ncbi:MAG: hypothetical protein WKF51_11550 [Geodermatophilaceae bacterium]
MTTRAAPSPGEVAASDVVLQQLAADLERRISAEFTWSVAADPRVPGTGYVVLYSPASSGRLVVSALLLVGEALTSDTLRHVPISAFENAANLSRHDVNRQALADLPPLRRSPELSSEEFSKLVADHYLLWAAAVPNPASAMAAEHGVKLPTMHGWIREARLRGLLPRAQRGKR